MTMDIRNGETRSHLAEDDMERLMLAVVVRAESPDSSTPSVEAVDRAHRFLSGESTYEELLSEFDAQYAKYNHGDRAVSLRP